MDILFYVIAIGALFAFGYFLGNDRIPSLWSTLAIIIVIIVASFFTALINIDPDSLTHNFRTEFAYSILRLASFSFGFQLGYRRRHKYWQAAATANALCIAVLVVYLIYLA